MLLPQAIPAIEVGLTAISILVTLNAAGDEEGVVGVCVGALVGVAVGALVGEVVVVVVPDGLPARCQPYHSQTEENYQHYSLFQHERCSLRMRCTYATKHKR